MIARILALIAHELIAPIAAEYRKLDQAPCCHPDADEVPGCDPTGTTAASTDRADGWDHDKRAPAVAARRPFGIRG